MSGFVLSAAARADLDEIWEYTAERWSIEQAERYIRAIVDACQALSNGRWAGAAVDHIREGYFKLASACTSSSTAGLALLKLSWCASSINAWMWRRDFSGRRS